MNKLAVLAAAAVVTVAGVTAVHSLTETSASTPSRVRPVLGESQSPRFVRNEDGDIMVNTPHRRRHLERGDQRVAGRGDHTEPGDDNGG
jgi:hypothetical protein